MYSGSGALARAIDSEVLPILENIHEKIQLEEWTSPGLDSAILQYWDPGTLKYTSLEHL